MPSSYISGDAGESGGAVLPGNKGEKLLCQVKRFRKGEKKRPGQIMTLVSWFPQQWFAPFLVEFDKLTD